MIIFRSLLSVKSFQDMRTKRKTAIFLALISIVTLTSVYLWTFSSLNLHKKPRSTKNANEVEELRKGELDQEISNNDKAAKNDYQDDDEIVLTPFTAYHLERIENALVTNRQIKNELLANASFSISVESLKGKLQSRAPIKMPLQSFQHQHEMKEGRQKIGNGGIDGFFSTRGMKGKKRKTTSSPNFTEHFKTAVDENIDVRSVQSEGITQKVVNNAKVVNIDAKVSFKNNFMDTEMVIVDKRKKVDSHYNAWHVAKVVKPVENNGEVDNVVQGNRDRVMENSREQFTTQLHKKSKENQHEHTNVNNDDRLLFASDFNQEAFPAIPLKNSLVAKRVDNTQAAFGDSGDYRNTPFISEQSRNSFNEFKPVHDDFAADANTDKIYAPVPTTRPQLLQSNQQKENGASNHQKSLRNPNDLYSPYNVPNATGVNIVAMTLYGSQLRYTHGAIKKRRAHKTHVPWVDSSCVH